MYSKERADDYRIKDLIILGNGMAGMTAALYAKRARLDFKIVGKDEFDFGQITNAILVENFPGVEPMSGFDLAMKLHDQIVGMGIEIEEHEVIKVEQLENKLWQITYKDGAVDEAKAVIYALGARHRELPCKIEQGVHIHYCALCDGPLYQDKRVVVVGGGDVAFTQAEYLSKICSEVRILMCDENITANAALVERVNKIHNVSINFNCPIVSILNKNSSNESYWILCEGVRGPIFADGIFVAIGMIPNTEPAKISLMNEGGYIPVRAEQRSEYIGLFAAGDVTLKRMKQAVTAAADGAIAVNSVIEFLTHYDEYVSF